MKALPTRWTEKKVIKIRGTPDTMGRRYRLEKTDKMYRLVDRTGVEGGPDESGSFQSLLGFMQIAGYQHYSRGGRAASLPSDTGNKRITLTSSHRSDFTAPLCSCISVYLFCVQIL